MAEHTIMLVCGGRAYTDRDPLWVYGRPSMDCIASVESPGSSLAEPKAPMRWPRSGREGPRRTMRRIHG